MEHSGLFRGAVAVKREERSMVIAVRGYPRVLEDRDDALGKSQSITVLSTCLTIHARFRDSTNR